MPETTITREVVLDFKTQATGTSMLKEFAVVGRDSFQSLVSVQEDFSTGLLGVQALLQDVIETGRSSDEIGTGIEVATEILDRLSEGLDETRQKMGDDAPSGFFEGLESGFTATNMLLEEARQKMTEFQEDVGGSGFGGISESAREAGDATAELGNRTLEAGEGARDLADRIIAAHEQIAELASSGGSLSELSDGVNQIGEEIRIITEDATEFGQTQGDALSPDHADSLIVGLQSLHLLFSELRASILQIQSDTESGLLGAPGSLEENRQLIESTKSSLGEMLVAIREAGETATESSDNQKLAYSEAEAAVLEYLAALELIAAQMDGTAITEFSEDVDELTKFIEGLGQGAEQTAESLAGLETIHLPDGSSFEIEAFSPSNVSQTSRNIDSLTGKLENLFNTIQSPQVQRSLNGIAVSATGVSVALGEIFDGLERGEGLTIEMAAQFGNLGLQLGTAVLAGLPAVKSLVGALGGTASAASLATGGITAVTTSVSTAVSLGPAFISMWEVYSAEMENAERAARLLREEQEALSSALQQMESNAQAAVSTLNELKSARRQEENLENLAFSGDTEEQRLDRRQGRVDERRAGFRETASQQLSRAIGRQTEFLRNFLGVQGREFTTSNIAETAAAFNEKNLIAIQQLDKQIADQQGKVDSLRSGGADKDEIAAAVAELARLQGDRTSRVDRSESFQQVLNQLFDEQKELAAEEKQIIDARLRSTQKEEENINRKLQQAEREDNRVFESFSELDRFDRRDIRRILESEAGGQDASPEGLSHLSRLLGLGGVSGFENIASQGISDSQASDLLNVIRGDFTEEGSNNSELLEKLEALRERRQQLEEQQEEAAEKLIEVMEALSDDNRFIALIRQWADDRDAEGSTS